MTGASIEQTVAAFEMLRSGLISANTFGELIAQPSRRKGFGSTAKLMQKRAKQFSKKEARQWRKLMRGVQS